MRDDVLTSDWLTPSIPSVKMVAYVYTSHRVTPSPVMPGGQKQLYVPRSLVPSRFSHTALGWQSPRGSRAHSSTSLFVQSGVMVYPTSGEACPAQVQVLLPVTGLSREGQQWVVEPSGASQSHCSSVGSWGRRSRQLWISEGAGGCVGFFLPPIRRRRYTRRRLGCSHRRTARQSRVSRCRKLFFCFWGVNCTHSSLHVRSSTYDMYISSLFFLFFLPQCACVRVCARARVGGTPLPRLAHWH